MEAETQIIIADDHPIFRKGLRAAIESEPGLKVVGEAADGNAALALIGGHEPDVVILDLDMPGQDGFAVARAVAARNLAIAVIILTMHDSESLFNTALDLGVRGFVLKDSALPEITDCIKAVVAGRDYISPVLSTYLISRAARGGALAREKPGIRDLTPAERNILRLIAAEKTSRQIADELHISVRTVDRHRSNISAKLDLSGANALIRFALKHESEF
ncbi:MAG TPA: response regulator transcription factor [Pyrinomonadaceae bacterium]|nr:response regulator transcription factor [Pyrinomonadaceae bacterium]